METKKILQKEYKGKAKDYGEFRFLAPSAEHYMSYGIPENEAKCLEYLLMSQLGTHQLKEDFKRDFAKAIGMNVSLTEKKDVPEAEREQAKKNIKGVYSFNFDAPPKTRKSKWGEYSKYLPAVKAQLKDLGKENVSDDDMLKYLKAYAKAAAAIKIELDDEPEE